MLLILLGLCAIIILVLIVLVFHLRSKLAPTQIATEDLLQHSGASTFLIDGSGHVLEHYTSTSPDTSSRAQVLCRDSKEVFEWIDTNSRKELQTVLTMVSPTAPKQIEVQFNGDVLPSKIVLVSAGYNRYYFVVKPDCDNSVEQKNMRNRSLLMEEMLNNLPLPTMVKDVSSRGAYLLWNKQAEQLYGICPDAMGALDMHTLPGELQQTLTDGDREANQSGAFETTLSTTLHDGEMHKLNIQKRMVRTADGHKWIITATTDMTQLDAQHRELERKELDLRAALTRADASNRLKSEFLSNMSHEIRTPLNGIVGFSECMVESENAEERRELFKEISRCSGNLSAIIDGVIRLAQLETGEEPIHNESFILSQLIREVATSSAGNVYGKPIKLYEELPENSYGVNADKEKIRDVLSQFLSNAIKFTESGRVILGYRAAARSIRLFVRDSGIGIAPDQHEFIFDRFAKVNPMVQGIGLGLSVCRALAAAMGGRISVESELGKGSTFYLDLPCIPFSQDGKSSALGRIVGQAKD